MNVDITGKTIKILHHDEILQKDDIVRLLVETGDEAGFDLTYKPEEYKPLAWQPVEEELPGWIEKPIKDLSFHFWYEYARIIN